MQVSTGPVSREAALESANALETAIKELMSGTRKPGQIPVEPVARLIQFARDTLQPNSTARVPSSSVDASKTALILMASGQSSEEVLSDAETLALAQLAKRITWSDLRSNSASDDETRLMVEAMFKLQKALAGVGYAPR